MIYAEFNCHYDLFMYYSSCHGLFISILFFQAYERGLMIAVIPFTSKVYILC